ncbi:MULTISPECIES: hypothetical protein [Nostocales]|nr:MULTISPECIES: hypothetical protein [Nostocales]
MVLAIDYHPNASPLLMVLAIDYHPNASPLQDFNSCILGLYL